MGILQWFEAVEDLLPAAPTPVPEGILMSKQRIAVKAYDLIRPDDLVFLDISSLTAELAQIIGAGTKPMTVVSNMPLAVERAAASPEVRAIATGGDFKPGVGGCIGPHALHALERFNFDACFLGAGAIDDEGWAATSNEAERVLKRLVIERTTNPYLLAGQAKFGASGPVPYATLADFKTVVTDGLTPETQAFVKSFGCGWI